MMEPSTIDEAPPPSDDATLDTPARIAEEGMRLFAREGMNAVSLRRVVQAAGAQNPSALHYHFGTREGLVAAIAERLRQRLEPRACARLDAMAGTAFSLRDVMEATFGPVLELLEDRRWGRDAVAFIGRLGWDFGERGQELSADLHRQILARALARLQECVPEAGVETLQFRLIVSMNAVYYGVSYRNYLKRSPFGPMPLAEAGNEARERREFMDYLEAGMRTIPPPS
ncbi:MAG: TetR/AcrR family transcriptional regulator [Variovorax sp.]|nr:MAG: TetR/AcrR family transcriptional regulator [Variovorax sp.]